MKIDKLYTGKTFIELQKTFFEGQSVIVEHLFESPKAFVAAFAQRVTKKHLLVITGKAKEEESLYHDIACFSDYKRFVFPSYDTLPGEEIAPSLDIVGERYRLLTELLGSKEPLIVFTTVQSLLQKLPSLKNFQLLSFSLQKGESVGFKNLHEMLEMAGYQKGTLVQDKGQFAVRGGIIDVFPITSPHPCRIEFFAEEIDSLRLFDPISQKSLKIVENLEIAPAEEEVGEASLFDFLGENTLCVFDDLFSIEERYTDLKGLLSPQMYTLEDILKETFKRQSLYFSDTNLDDLTKITLKNPRQGGYYAKGGPLIPISFEMFTVELHAHRFISPFIPLDEYFLEKTTEEDPLKALEVLSENEDIYILCQSQAEEAKFQRKIQGKNIQWLSGYLTEGFSLKEEKLIIFPLTEITHQKKIRRQMQRASYHTEDLSWMFSLQVGEMVVHTQNGLGRYLGLERRENYKKEMAEYFVIEYDKQARLFVPIDQAHLISKYIGSSEKLPKLSVLGSKSWQKVREKTELAIFGYAQDLIKLYAEREIVGGFKYPEDSEAMRSFEESFPFTETDDQLEAIKQVKADMVSDKAMDRLICGDVGYGKTEVAIRAAFKACIDGGKQVAFLVPTTVLALQHYETILERMGNFPIEIGLLCRLGKKSDQEKLLNKLAEGTIDIVIGTHRILSQDVAFKNLGLVIIDEEQRFGVKAKEHLKALKKGVDCLTLSATPIPRTLYMSMIGGRDMSVINTPPQDRLPIKTMIVEPNVKVMQQALQRELAREGQVYIIHNRVETIYEYAASIQTLVPQARIIVGHGQMSAEEIDHVFHTFKQGNADILVSTTIVENGVDIANANTILIDRADRFGLSDLYQLRGRVGRWNRPAFAYFMIKKFHQLPEISRQRLQALCDSSGFGGGLKLALRDLEIRGAGDMLGLEQSGHVSAVGFTLYCKLLKRAIAAMQGKVPLNLCETKLEINLDGRFPEDYIDDMRLRMQLYQRLGDALDDQELDALWKEVIDRFGKPPIQAEALYQLTKIRIFANRNGITLVKQINQKMYFEKKEGTKITKRENMLTPSKNFSDFAHCVIKALQ
jgi:transcription-repair coupling factor (superfamily II helicase)